MLLLKEGKNMNIMDILVCPACHTSVNAELCCSACGTSYAGKLGVFDMLNGTVSGDQVSLWGIDETVFEEEAELQRHNEKQQALIDDYHAHINQESKDAEAVLEKVTEESVKQVRGVVCDLATGNGGMLDYLLKHSQAEQIVCTDIDPLVLARTRRRLNTDDKKVFYVASDGRQMSLADESFDYVTSLAGLGNVPETERACRELYRILKPGGVFLMKSSYLEFGSRSHEIAKELKLDKGLIEEELVKCLYDAGFTKVKSIVAGEAVWAENPYDLLPVAGDRQKYCLIKAVK